MLKFSGHDTFHCKEQWILKGLQLIEKEEDISIFKDLSAIPKLGVGKNMVSSIKHWVKSFGIVNKEGRVSSFWSLILDNKGYDPYLENKGTWRIKEF